MYVCSIAGTMSVARWHDVGGWWPLVARGPWWHREAGGTVALVGPGVLVFGLGGTISVAHQLQFCWRPVVPPETKTPAKLPGKAVA